MNASQDGRVSSLGLDTVLKNLGAPFRALPFGVGKVIEGALRNPVLDALDARSPLARQTLQELVNNPWILEKHTQDGASPTSVIDHIGEYKGAYADWAHEANQEWKRSKGGFTSYDDYGKRLYSALINGDVDSGGHAGITRIAKLARENVFEPIRKELIAQGRLPADWNSATAISYVSRHWNREHIRANETEVTDLLAAHFNSQLKEEQASLFRERDTRNADVSAQRTVASDAAKKAETAAKDKFRADTAVAKEHLDALAARHEQVTAKTIATLRQERLTRESKATQARDEMIKEHRISRDELLRGDVTPKERTAYRQQFKDEVAKLNATHAAQLDAIKKEYQGSTGKKGGVTKGKVAKALDELNAKHDLVKAPHHETMASAKAAREAAITDAKAARDAAHAQILKTTPQLPIGVLVRLRLTLRPRLRLPRKPCSSG